MFVYVCICIRYVYVCIYDCPHIYTRYHIYGRSLRPNPNPNQIATQPAKRHTLGLADLSAAVACRYPNPHPLMSLLNLGLSQVE